ncbi:hypothetical protein ACHAQA_001884 [Verticillium albo-atrum]
MATMSATNAWLTRQRKSDLVELAELVNLEGISGQKKADLEVTLDEFLAENEDTWAREPRFTPYYTSRARAAGSPTKRDLPKDDALKVVRRRTTRAASEILNADSEPEAESDSATALVARTPARALTLASRIPLPASPAEVAQVVDRGAIAVRERASSIYQASGITERTQAVRESLSTVTAIISTIAVFELYCLRREVLPGLYAFTIPSFPALGNSPQPVYVSDMFQILTSTFWSPVLTWTATSLVLPSLFGYFYNLSAASRQPVRRGRSAAHAEPDYNVDPLVFSIVKALAAFLVLGQGVTFGLVQNESIDRINSALYGGWQGVLAGAAISGLVSVYDAVLRK